ncbi:uncharacterized protein si:ch211-191i18.2 [Conger conger]|nr:uncharacterized protein si:ch211-191i18.2 [Conger conger]
MCWLPGHLLPLCMLGALLLYTSSAQEEDYGDYDVTASPDYDYNATFDYSFFSNTSGGMQELEDILEGGVLREEEDEDEEEPEDRGGKKENAACCSSPSLLLFHSLLLIQLCWLLCA